MISSKARLNIPLFQFFSDNFQKYFIFFHLYFILQLTLHCQGILPCTASLSNWHNTPTPSLKQPMRSFHAFSQAKHLRLNAQIMHLYKQFCTLVAHSLHEAFLCLITLNTTYLIQKIFIWKQYKSYETCKLMETCVTLLQLHKIKIETKALIQSTVCL